MECFIGTEKFEQNISWIYDIYSAILYHTIILFHHDKIKFTLDYEPEFKSRGFEKNQQKIKFPPVGIELTTLTLTGLGVKWLSNGANQTYVTWQTLSLFHAPFHFLDLDDF